MPLIDLLLSVVIPVATAAAPWAGGTAATASALYLAGRTIVEHRTRRNRVTLAAVPLPGHNVDAEAIRSNAASIGSAVQRRGGSLLGRRVDGITITHRPDRNGKLVTLISAPKHAQGGIEASLRQWANVEVRPLSAIELPLAALAMPENEAHTGATSVPDDRTSGEQIQKPKKPYVARMELRRGGPVIGTLAGEGLIGRNPLGAVANVCKDLAIEDGEDFALVVQQLPLSRRSARNYRAGIAKKLDRWVATVSKDGIDTWNQLRLALGAPEELDRTRNNTPSASAKQGDLETRKEARKQSLKDQPLVHLRIYIFARAKSPKRARALVNAVHDALAPLNGHAELKAVGIGGGVLPFIGINALKPHRHTDRIVARGMMPTDAPVLTANEIGPLSGPPTDSAKSQYIRRAVPLEAAPEEMPTYDRDNPNHVLLGEVATYSGQPELKAIMREDEQMAFIAAPTGNGKTATVSTDTVHLARASNTALTPRAGERAVELPDAIKRGLRGSTWIDPEGTVAEPLRPYLADLDLISVCEVNLKTNGRVPSWNPLSMYGRTEDEVDDVTEATVTAVAAALGWAESSGRALNLITMTCRALVDLNLKACQAGRPDAQNTIYQITDMLDVDNPTFRDSASQLLPEHMRGFWKNVTQNYARDALPVVTNAFRRLEPENSCLTAFFGRPISTLDFRDVLNNGHLVFFTPPQTKTAKLITHMLVAHLMREAMRRNPEKGDVVPHDFNIDEINSLRDMEEVAMMAERGRKRRTYLKTLAQSPQRMDATTLQGVIANSKHIQVGGFNGRDAAIAAGWLGLPDPAAFDDLERYQWFVKYPIAGVHHGPSLVRGCPPQEIWGDKARPDLVSEYLDRMDHNFGRKTWKEAAPEYRRHRAKLATFHDELLNQPSAGPRKPLGFAARKDS